MMPPAPNLFSTRTGVFHTWLSSWVIALVRTSASPPAGYATLTRTGLFGKLWAAASLGSAIDASTNANAPMNVSLIMIIPFHGGGPYSADGAGLVNLRGPTERSLDRRGDAPAH